MVNMLQHLFQTENSQGVIIVIVIESRASQM